MAKNAKFRLSFLNSFQICRPKNPSSLVKTPLPVSYLFSPVSSKSYDISFPSFPNPPPSTPNHPSSKRGVTQSKISPFKCECHSKSSKMKEDQFSSDICSGTRKEDKGKMKHKGTISTDSDKRPLQIEASRIEKKKEKTRQSLTSISSGNSTEETDHSIFSSPPSLNSSHDHFKMKMKKEISDRTRRFKRFGSKDWKEGVITGSEEKPVSRRLVPCLEDGKLNQSFVVVKRSFDPYEDFKKSMLEMIIDKEMFEPEELEQLLMSFLSLNSRLHHIAIIEAFTEIWKQVFELGLLCK